MINISGSMKWIFFTGGLSIVLLLFFIFSGMCIDTEKEIKIRVLILSGQNNHEWQETTPVLVKMFEEAGQFEVRVTHKPDTLKYEDLKKSDVVFSNWNSWPDNAMRLPDQWEKDFVRFVKEGGGTIFLHAGASSFYGWEEYHRIGIGRWGKATQHGKLTEGLVSGFDRHHPITSGMRDFRITDEIWEKTEIFPGSELLATVSAEKGKDGKPVTEPAVLVTTFGKGRSFYTALGHNAVVLKNPDLQCLLLRATQWSAGRRVSIGCITR